MQFLLLFVLSLSSSCFSVLLTQWQLSERRRRAKNFFLLCLGFVLNVFFSIVAEGILKAGRPTFYYHTHAPGSVTLKIFGLGCVLAFLIYSLCLTVVERKQSRYGLPVWLVRSVLISLLVAVVCELFVFNMRHYELMGYDKPRKDYPVTNFWYHGFYYNRASHKVITYPQVSTYFGFTAFFSFEKVRNLYFDFDDGNPRTRFNLSYMDRSHRSKLMIPAHEFIKGIPRSYNIPVHTVGKTYDIEMHFPDAYARVDDLYTFSLPQITINQVVPLELSLSRFSLTCLLAFLVCCFWPGSQIYSVPLNLRSPLQIALIVMLLLACFVWFGWTVFSSYSGSELTISEQKSVVTQNHLQYNWLIDALMVPRYALLQAPYKDLVSADDPYDMSQREIGNYYYPWDTALYDGQFYVYFGVVPALAVLLPYRLLTGQFLELDYAILFFSCLGLCGLYGLYSLLARRYFRGISFGLYILGFMLLVSVLGLTWALRRGLVYELAVTSAFCFMVWAVFLIFAAFEVQRGGWFLIFSAGLSAALAVGCRPTALICSLVVISVFICRLRECGKLCSVNSLLRGVLLLIPYLAVGLMLMKYNYERFDDPFEFGITYQLTTANEATGLPRSSLWSTFISMLCYFFTPASFDMSFPFVHVSHPQIVYNGFILDDGSLFGLFAFPLIWFVWLLPVFRKTMRDKGLSLVSFSCSSVLSGLILCLIASRFSITCRYLIDFAWLFGLTAVMLLFCVYQYFDNKGLCRWVQSAALFCFLAGLVLFISLSLTGEDDWFTTLNPLYFDKLRYAYSFWL